MQQSENCEENFKIHFLTLIWTTKQGLANYVLSHAYKVHISTPNTYIHYINHFKCYNDHFHKYIKITANTIKTVNQIRTKAQQMVLMLLFVFFISFKMAPLSSSPLFSPKLVSLITSLVFPNTSSSHKKNPHPPPCQKYQKNILTTISVQNLSTHPLITYFNTKISAYQNHNKIKWLTKLYSSQLISKKRLDRISFT